MNRQGAKDAKEKQERKKEQKNHEAIIRWFLVLSCFSLFPFLAFLATWRFIWLEVLMALRIGIGCDRWMHGGTARMVVRRRATTDGSAQEG